MPPDQNSTHTYHHYDPTPPKVNVKIEKNSRGTIYEATVIGATSVDEAMMMLQDVVGRLEKEYGGTTPTPK